MPDSNRYEAVDGVERSQAHNDGRLTCCPATGKSDKGMQKKKVAFDWLPKNLSAPSSQARFVAPLSAA